MSAKSSICAIFNGYSRTPARPSIGKHPTLQTTLNRVHTRMPENAGPLRSLVFLKLLVLRGGFESATTNGECKVNWAEREKMTHYRERAAIKMPDLLQTSNSNTQLTKASQSLSSLPTAYHNKIPYRRPYPRMANGQRSEQTVALSGLDEQFRRLKIGVAAAEKCTDNRRLNSTTTMDLFDGIPLTKAHNTFLKQRRHDSGVDLQATSPLSINSQKFIRYYRCGQQQRNPAGRRSTVKANDWFYSAVNLLPAIKKSAADFATEPLFVGLRFLKGVFLGTATPFKANRPTLSEPVISDWTSARPARPAAPHMYGRSAE